MGTRRFGVLWASAMLLAAAFAWPGCGSLGTNSIKKGGGVHVKSPDLFLRAERGLPVQPHMQELAGRELLRCYEAELGDHLQYSDPNLMLTFQTNGSGGLVIRAEQGQFSSSGRFTNCIWASTKLWDWDQFDRESKEHVLPVEFGRSPELGD